jgi:hypothetical protein
MMTIVIASDRLDIVVTLGPLSDLCVPRGAYDSDLPRDPWLLLVLRSQLNPLRLRRLKLENA